MKFHSDREKRKGLRCALSLIPSFLILFWLRSSENKKTVSQPRRTTKLIEIWLKVIEKKRTALLSFNSSLSLSLFTSLNDKLDWNYNHYEFISILHICSCHLLIKSADFLCWASMFNFLGLPEKKTRILITDFTFLRAQDPL